MGQRGEIDPVAEVARRLEQLEQRLADAEAYPSKEWLNKTRRELTDIRSDLVDWRMKETVDERDLVVPIVEHRTERRPPCDRCGEPVEGDLMLYRGAPIHPECWVERMNER